MTLSWLSAILMKGPWGRFILAYGMSSRVVLAKSFSVVVNDLT